LILSRPSSRVEATDGDARAMIMDDIPYSRPNGNLALSCALDSASHMCAAGLNSA
jgi:hypothetical protein